jgi:phage/plasmid-associated DNA primase
MMLNEEEYEYLMDILAYIIHGGNWLSLFFIFTGSGANGKSVIGNLLTGALGSYFKTMNPKSITTKKTRPNETSDWVNTKGKRCILFSEPDDKDKIQSDVFKIITGNDEITERALYKESVTFTPQFTPILLCNVIPELSKKDGGVERRLHCVDFPFKFMEEEKYDPKNPIHKRRNTEVLQKSKYDKNYHIQFLLILIHRFCVKNMKRYTQLIAPDRQKKCTTAYYNSEEAKLEKYLDKYYVYKNVPVEHKKKDWVVMRSEFYREYQQNEGKLSLDVLKTELEKLNIGEIRMKGYMYFYPIKVIEEEPECEIVEADNDC